MFNEWYLARDKNTSVDVFIVARPTEFASVKKHYGCVEYVSSEI